MADDLIPPPSPAGRPPTDPRGPGEPLRLPPGPADDRGGGGLWSGEAAAGRVSGRGPSMEAQAEEAPAAVAAPEPLPPSPYRPRFGVLAGALAGLAIATVALAAILIGGVGSGAPSGWSDWKPSSQDRLAAAREIADHVAPRYRQAGDKQLVMVTAGPLQVQHPPVELAGVAVPRGGGIELVQGDTVMYTLNGLGVGGSIAVGTPSEGRHLLLRREALELALYTFRYARDVDVVVALLPPNAEAIAAASRPTATPRQVTQARPHALLFRAGDLRRQLDAPLRETLAARTPRPETVGGEASRIERLTRPNLFQAEFKQAQDLKAYLVLQPVR